MSFEDHRRDGGTRTGRPSTAPVWRMLLWVSTAGAVVCLALLVVWTYQITSEAAPPLWLWLSHGGEQSDLYERSSAVVWVFAIFGFLAWVSYVWPRRRSPRNTGVVVALAIAAATTVLAAATYLPCRPHTSDVVPPLAWVLSTFEGDYELAGPGARCSLAFPPGFELARALAFLLIIYTATAVIRVFARQSIDRWYVAWHSDVDVVVGLDQQSLALVKALVRERDSRHRLEEWVEPRPGWLLPRIGSIESSSGRVQGRSEARRAKPYVGVSTLEYWLWWLTGLRKGDWRHLLRRQTSVAVIDLNKDNPLISEIRRLGVRVIIGDATTREILCLTTHRSRLLPPRRVSLRRMYAVTWHQRTNLSIFETARQLLTEGRQIGQIDDVIPRLFVRMDSTREARQWRLEQLEGLGGKFFADAITPVGIAASFVATKVIPEYEWLSGEDSVTHVLLVGESSLALALLDELAWQQWARYEVALYQFEQLRDSGVPAADMNKAREELMLAANPALRRVSLLGPNPQTRSKEWAATRAPWNAGATDVPDLRLFTVQGESGEMDDEHWHRSENDWERVADEALSNPVENAVVVFVDAGDSYEAAASRLVRSHHTDRTSTVLLRVDEQGSWPTPVTRGGVQRFVPSLVHVSELGDIAPADSVMRLARQQHTVYLGRWPVATDTDHACRDISLRRSSRVTNVDWRDLPRFFKEDNIRQHWQVLNWFAQPERRDWQWRRVTLSEVSEDRSDSAWGLPSEVVEDVARDESSRWNGLRRRHGWWLVCNRDCRHDPRRLTDRMTDWQDKTAGGKQGDTDLIRLILRRLWATGLMAARSNQRHEVRADPLK